jgi:hypothetical protein
MSQRRNVSRDQTLPTPACENGLKLRDHGKGLRRKERCASRKFDEHIDRIGASELGVETAACGNRLLLVRHLIGEPISRLKAGVDGAESDDHDEAEPGVFIQQYSELVAAD